MTDIVNRLRSKPLLLAYEAADEIGRLRAALEQAADDLDEYGFPLEAKTARRALEQKP